MGAFLAGVLSNDGAVKWPARLALLALTALPVVLFAYKAACGFAPGGAGAAGAVFSWGLLARSLALSAAAAALATAAGVPAGLVAGRLSGAWRPFGLFAFILPLTLPPSIHAYIWRNLAMSGGFLGALFVEGGSKAVNSAGAVWSLACAFWAIPALAAMAVSSGPGRRFEMEARPFASTQAALKKILIPSLKPVAAVSAGAVFILSFAEYGAPALWQVTTFPVRIQALYGSFFEVERAAAASVVPAVLTGAAAWLMFARGRRALALLDVQGTCIERELLWRPGGSAKAMLAAVTGVFVVVPVAASVYWMFSARATLANVAPVFDDLLVTLAVSALVSSAACALAALYASSHWPKSGLWQKAGAVSAFAAFLIPSVALALAVKSVWQWNAVPAFLSRGGAPYRFALVSRFLVVPLGLSVLALARLDRRYAKLTVVHAAGGFRKLKATAPGVLAPALLAGWVITLVLCVGELSMGILLAPPGGTTVSVRLFDLMHYARQGDALAVALVMMFGSGAAVVGALAIAGRLWKRYQPAAS